MEEKIIYANGNGRNFSWSRVARFFLVHHTKTGKNVPNEHTIYQMAIKYRKYS
jgi:hypothetical protein